MSGNFLDTVRILPSRRRIKPLEISLVLHGICTTGSITSSTKGFLFGPLTSGVRGSDLNIVAIDAVPVQGFDCLVRFGIAWHLDETESF